MAGSYYFESKNIKIFPSTNRGSYAVSDSGGSPASSTLGFDPEAELNTEFNYTHIPGLDGTRSSFVLKWPTEASSTLKCVIAGYYFEIYDAYTFLGNINTYPIYLNVCLGGTNLSTGLDGVERERNTYILAAWDFLQNEAWQGSPALVTLDQRNGEKYLFYGLQVTAGATAQLQEAQAGRFEVYSLQIKKSGSSWCFENQIFQSLNEGEGQYALFQSGGGTKTKASGDYTVILGPHNREVNSPNAVVIGSYSKNPSTGYIEYFVVGDGVDGDSRHNIFAITKKEDSEGYVQIHGGKLIAENAKFTDKVEFIADQSTADSTADTSPIILERSISASNSARISNILLTDAHITTPPEDPDSPIRLEDIKIDSTFFESLYNGSGTTTNNTVGG